MNELSTDLLIGIFVATLILSAFFSGTETGMMSLNRYRLKHLLQKGDRRAQRVSKLLDRPDRMISLILIGNNLVNFTGSLVFAGLTVRWWGESELVALVITPVVLTFIFLIFGEITPKTYAAFHPERVAFPASAILRLLMWPLFPVVWFINQVTNRLVRLSGIRPEGGNNMQLSRDELRTIVGEAGPHIPQRHQRMLLNILDLDQATVEDIMIPRNEVLGIDLDDDDQTILQTLRDSEFTRMPVFRGDFDNIQGILHQRNTSRIIDENGDLDREMLMTEMIEPYFIPEATPLHIQLRNFQKEKSRIGIVVDEYGAAKGLVTLEDILEEIVGEFTSNLADDIDDIHPQADGSFIIHGTATIRDINRMLNWELPSEGPKTLNGLLVEELESFPEGAACLRIGRYNFEILELKSNLIQTALARQV